MATTTAPETLPVFVLAEVQLREVNAARMGAGKAILTLDEFVEEQRFYQEVYDDCGQPKTKVA